MIEFEQTGFTYDGETFVLQGIELSIPSGQFVCILGGNGSGKSTLAKHINALLVPDEGAVSVLGHDTRDESALYLIRSNAGMVFQNPDDQLVASLVEDDVAFGPENLGVETAEMLKAVTDLIKPELLVVCDALAAGDVSRIGTTIQIADSGINPGSGLGNERTAINQSTMGVPVLAIGVPTVVNAAVIAHNILENFLDELEAERPFAQIRDQLSSEIFERAAAASLHPYNNRLNVTPKEIDDLINNTASVIAKALSLYLHPNMNADFAEIFV